MDVIASHPPRHRPLVIAVTAEDDTTAERFLTGYRGRLSDIEENPLVPHAFGADVAHSDAPQPEPDVVLLDELVNQLQTTIPSGAGQ